MLVSLLSLGVAWRLCFREPLNSVTLQSNSQQDQQHYLDEGELLAHALVHSGPEAQVGEGLLLLLPLRSESVRVELRKPQSRPQSRGWRGQEKKVETVSVISVTIPRDATIHGAAHAKRKALYSTGTTEMRHNICRTTRCVLHVRTCISCCCPPCH